MTADPDMASAWSSDELVHDVVTLRAGEEVARLALEADALLRGAGVPVLVLLGGEDAVGAQQWPAAEEAAGVEVKTYSAGRHDLFHDAVRGEVIADLSTWLKG